MRSITKSVILAGALVVFAVVALKGAAILIPTGTWVPQTNLSSARANASAALLQDGRVLITGGDSGSGPVATADFFAADGTISAAPPMVNARSKHVAVTLQDGRVLVAGGITAGGSATSTAEIYDPAANSWTNIGTGMTEARSGATAALMQDGRVIIAGGQNGSSISSTIEIFDPVAESFTLAGTCRLRERSTPWRFSKMAVSLSLAARTGPRRSLPPTFLIPLQGQSLPGRVLRWRALAIRRQRCWTAKLWSSAGTTGMPIRRRWI